MPLNSPLTVYFEAPDEPNVIQRARVSLAISECSAYAAEVLGKSVYKVDCDEMRDVFLVTKYLRELDGYQILDEENALALA